MKDRMVKIDRLELLIETSNENIVDEITISNLYESEVTDDELSHIFVLLYPSGLKYYFSIFNIDEHIFMKNKERVMNLQKLTNIKIKYIM